jgi:hypothetical protein
MSGMAFAASTPVVDRDLAHLVNGLSLVGSALERACRRSALEEAEGVSRRIRVDSPASGVDMQ